MVTAFEPATFFLFFFFTYKSIIFSTNVFSFIWFGFVSHLPFKVSPASWWGKSVTEWGLSCQTGSASGRKLVRFLWRQKPDIREGSLHQMFCASFSLNGKKQRLVGHFMCFIRSMQVRVIQLVSHLWIWVKIGNQPTCCLGIYAHKIKQKYKGVKNIFGFKKFVQFLL